MPKKTKKQKRRLINNYFKSKAIQRALISAVTIIIAFFIIENGASPKKYKLSVGERSNYDITAPREIENHYLTEQLAEEAANAVPPVMMKLENVPIDTLNLSSEFFSEIITSRQSIINNLQEQGVTKNDENYVRILELEQTSAVGELELRLKRFNMPLSAEQIEYMVARAGDEELSQFDKLTRTLISSVMKEEVTADNLSDKINLAQNEFQKSDISQELKNIGSIMAKALIKPNSVIDEGMTDKKKIEVYNDAMKNKLRIQEGTRILSFGDIVTEDKLAVLKELNWLETGKLDYSFTGGILAVILILAFMLVLYMHFFCKKFLEGRKELILLCVIILLDLVAAWLLNPIAPLLIPVFIAPMLISILLDIRLGIVVNLILAMAISLITKGDQGFLFTAIICGTFSAFIVSGANQRSRLSAAGLVIAVVNAFVITLINLISKDSLTAMVNDGALAAVNGMLSTIFTIGTLPIFESLFKIVTPLKLLELSDPNQPLMKKLLMEAPGTYHHSLMVGNLAEVATEAIKGNALLARVGAYYHDVGKLKRPNFFKENQLSENPHDKMSPNLSTLVITSHTTDGAEIAEKYKVPLAVRNIICQHHGTTLAAFFYYKAQQEDKSNSVKLEDFRYQGPKPSSKEAAVVMLADSVEAAVRSMADKTEGKIVAMVRKIIKDKLDDGQLDQCELTLKDLDMMAKAFTRVFGGYFHERQEYPELKIKQLNQADESIEIPNTITGYKVNNAVYNNGVENSIAISENIAVNDNTALEEAEEEHSGYERRKVK